MKAGLKAITILQPWASLLMRGQKVYETRSWRPPARLVGKCVAIHAGKGRQGIAAAREDLTLSTICAQIFGGGWAEPGALPTGAFLGLGLLLGSCETHLGPALPYMEGRIERAMGDWSPGRYAWRFSTSGRRVLAEPLAFSGAQRLWTVPMEVEARLWDRAEPV